MKRILFFAFLALATLSFNGCQSARTILAWTKSTDHLIALKQEPRVRHEPGAEELAQKVVPYLNDSISLVENLQGRPYVNPVSIFVFASEESFSEHSGVSREVRGCAFNGAIYLSSKLNRMPESIPLILAHELSHIHICQHVGLLTCSYRLPTWFLEGLAVSVSGGGGAERVSEKEAVDAILRGNHFIPDDSGSILVYKGAHYYGLQQHMFYRQAGMFLSYLRSQSPAEFNGFLSALLDGKPFCGAFPQTFGKSANEKWNEFAKTLK